jgi:hypothetical protein
MNVQISTHEVLPVSGSKGEFCILIHPAHPGGTRYIFSLLPRSGEIMYNFSLLPRSGESRYNFNPLHRSGEIRYNFSPLSRSGETRYNFSPIPRSKESMYNFNIPAAPAYGVYISQMIRYSRACDSYQDFLSRGLLLTMKLLNFYMYVL